MVLIPVGTARMARVLRRMDAWVARAGGNQMNIARGGPRHVPDWEKRRRLKSERLYRAYKAKMRELYEAALAKKEQYAPSYSSNTRRHSSLLLCPGGYERCHLHLQLVSAARPHGIHDAFPSRSTAHVC